MISTQMVLWLVTSWMLVRFFRYDLPTATLPLPRGHKRGCLHRRRDKGRDTVVVTFIHLVRLNAVIIVVPVLVTLFFSS